MKIEPFDNDRHTLQCYESCGNTADMVLEIGHSRVIVCRECLWMLAELLQVELSR